jgi:hypothetical protein
MNKERDLLPWILGGLSAAAIAVAFAAVSNHRDVPISPPQVVAAQSPASPTALPVSVTAQTAPPAAEPDAAHAAAPSPSQTAFEPQTTGGQIWECTTKGVKTFSNNPCGEQSTLLDVGPVNTMSASAPVHYVGAYGPQPRYASGYADQSAAADADDYSDQYAETDGNSYTIVQGVGFVAHRHAEHFHRPPAPHSTGHNSGPVRRN